MMLPFFTLMMFLNGLTIKYVPQPLQTKIPLPQMLTGSIYEAPTFTSESVALGGTATTGTANPQPQRNETVFLFPSTQRPHRLHLLTASRTQLVQGPSGADGGEEVESTSSPPSASDGPRTSRILPVDFVVVRSNHKISQKPTTDKLWMGDATSCFGDQCIGRLG